eukprot:gene32898-38092_t
MSGLYRYPVKGLSAQPMERVAISPDRPIPFDRIFALARPGVPVNADNPGWAKKGLFIMLMLEEQLASVQTRLDTETLVMTVMDGDRLLLTADLGSEAGRASLEVFIRSLVPTLTAPPRLIRSRDQHFMDKPDNVISLINLATVRSLEQKWGRAINQLRFRANLYLDGCEPWEEFDWIGHEIQVGEVVFSVDRRNGRCGATNVD